MIGSRLRLLRNERNLTQGEVAKNINVSQQTYNFYETEKHYPNFNTLKILSSYFEVSMSYLLGETDERVLTKTPAPSSTIFETESNTINSQSLSSLEKHIFKAYMALDYDIRQKLMEYLKQAYDTYLEEDTTQKEIEAELARYRLELEAEKLGKTSPASGGRKRNLG